MFGNFSKMIGGGLGGLISGVLIPNIVLPAFTGGGDIASACAGALSNALGNWTGTLTSATTAAVLGSLVTFIFPKNKPPLRPR